MRLTRCIFNQSKPLSPRGLPLAKNKILLLISLPRWLKWGGQGYVLPRKSILCGNQNTSSRYWGKQNITIIKNSWNYPKFYNTSEHLDFLSQKKKKKFCLSRGHQPFSAVVILRVLSLCVYMRQILHTQIRASRTIQLFSYASTR